MVTSLQNPTSLGHYLTGLHERLSQLDIGDADPAAFFDNAVSKLSASGHEAHFAAPHELLALFDSAGFSNSVAFVAPTPWLFSTRREAIWFAHELLGLGAACATPDHLTESQEATLASHISRYLNLKIVSDDLCILSWHLLFVMGENP
ncbi:MAG: hypothetical protein JNM18_09000 [Planctomycetaceae bacterium]|nr:hypothetical protein [Planctomycetaceae bacterium]